MTDYNIDKVSPRPWYYNQNIDAGPHETQSSIHDTSGDIVTLAFSGEAHTVPNDYDSAHIVHCVNLHDELVEALEVASKWIADDNAGWNVDEQVEMTAFKDLLARAKGETNNET